MKILATFVNFKHDDELIELVHAWDEYCADGNYDGYTKTRDEAVASYGDDILNHVTVTIDINETAVIHALNPSVTLAGEVSV